MVLHPLVSTRHAVAHLSRRTFFRGMLAAAASRVVAADAQTPQPPAFGTIRHQFTEIRGARPVPAIDIARIDGKAVNLTSFPGKILLVNFWATWCPACRSELPMLDRLQQVAGRSSLQIVAVAVDREGRAVVAPFVRSLNLRHLDIGLDPGRLIARADDRDPPDTPFALYGMPISYVIGATGRAEGYIAGAADWLSDEAKSLLAHYAAG